MGNRLGQQLGNYRLVKLLGTGGFAEVYLGQHVHLASKQAAIKVLQLHDVDAHQFQEEAETTEQLVHPHIVRLLDFAIEEGTPFLVLEYAPGGSLRTRHPRGSILPLATVGAYLQELTPALQYAHDRHILHRDIKPDNLLIGRQGELLLSDFGIAVLTQTGRTSLSPAYGIGGTPYYMAPETYRGRPVKQSDQYALAVVAYEWLSGSVPFREGNFIQLGYQHSFEPVPPLRERNPALPLMVEAVIMKALAKEARDRFASIETFAQAFEQASVQARQAEGHAHRIEEEQMRSAKEADRARLPREERLHILENQPSPMPSHTLPPTTAPDGALSPQGQNTLSAGIFPTTATTQWSGTLPTRPILTQPKRQSSPPVVALLIFLTMILVGGGSIGLYRAATGTWPGQGAQLHTTATTQAHGTATAHTQATVTTQASFPGVTWHDQIRTPNLFSITWAGSQFVAVGENGAVLTSPDGKTWTAQSSGTSNSLYGICWSGSQFVAVGSSSANNHSTILSSPDGKTWTAHTAVNYFFLHSVAWSGSQFVAVGVVGFLLTSPDGATWTFAGFAIHYVDLQSVVWSGSQFVAVGENGTILTSLDGKTWTAQNSGTSNTLDGVAWSGSQFVAVGTNGSILTSFDARTWTAQNSGTTQNLYKVVWASSQFVAVGTNGSILTSFDARTWTAQNSGTTYPLSSIAWSGSQFVAVGENGTVLTSP